MPVSPSRRAKIIRQRPVRLTGVVLAVLMFLNVKIFGDGAPAYVEFLTFLAPIIAALIAERFTFSQSFMREILHTFASEAGFLAPSQLTQQKVRQIQRRDKRLRGIMATGTNTPVPRDRGITTLGAVVILILFLILLLILLPGHRI